MEIHHFYHCYADGDWVVPLHEHIRALQVGGLYDHLDSFHIGFVGSDDNIAKVCDSLEVHGVRDYITCSAVAEGFEQETLDKLYDFSQDHDGAVLYAHTKGSANFAPINDPWRRSMEQKCVVEWRTAVAALECDGKAIVGCHWIMGNPEVERLVEAWRNRRLNPPGLDGVGGMFGGNYWWTRLELLRQNCRPGRESRYAAEHWLGQLSEVMPIFADTILDLNPQPITPSNLVPLNLT
jgi:hypothetical protein